MAFHFGPRSSASTSGPRALTFEKAKGQKFSLIRSTLAASKAFPPSWQSVRPDAINNLFRSGSIPPKGCGSRVGREGDVESWIADRETFDAASHKKQQVTDERVTTNYLITSSPRCCCCRCCCYWLWCTLKIIFNKCLRKRESQIQFEHKYLWADSGLILWTKLWKIISWDVLTQTNSKEPSERGREKEIVRIWSAHVQISPLQEDSHMQEWALSLSLPLHQRTNQTLSLSLSVYVYDSVASLPQACPYQCLYVSSLSYLSICLSLSLHKLLCRSVHFYLFVHTYVYQAMFLTFIST